MASSHLDHLMLKGKHTKSVTSSGSWSSEIDECTVEEVDMANCLILLSQGKGSGPTLTPTADNSGARKFSGTGFDAYDCNTCDRSFRSSRALGIHRATHNRKPKATVDEKKKDLVGVSMNSKIHECSICGLQLASGQALGGHKKRHWSIARKGNPMSAIIESVNAGEAMPRKFLPFDLNQPVPEIEDHQHPQAQLEWITIAENHIQ